MGPEVLASSPFRDEPVRGKERSKALGSRLSLAGSPVRLVDAFVALWLVARPFDMVEAPPFEPAGAPARVLDASAAEGEARLCAPGADPAAAGPLESDVLAAGELALGELEPRVAAAAMELAAGAAALEAIDAAAGGALADEAMPAAASGDAEGAAGPASGVEGAPGDGAGACGPAGAACGLPWAPGMPGAGACGPLG
jgi:hypothetical protein